VIRVLSVVLLLGTTSIAKADEVIDVSSAQGVPTRTLVATVKEPRATVLLFIGGDGLLRLTPSGQTAHGHTFVRSFGMWRAHGIEAVLVDSPEDLGNAMRGHQRGSQQPQFTTDLKGVPRPQLRLQRRSSDPARPIRPRQWSCSTGEQSRDTAANPARITAFTASRRPSSTQRLNLSSRTSIQKASRATRVANKVNYAHRFRAGYAPESVKLVRVLANILRP